MGQRINLKSRKMKICMLVALCIGIVIVGWKQQIVSHEEAHRQMFLYCGINSTIHYSLFGFSAYTEPERNANATCPANILNGLNENFFYPFENQFITLSLFFIVIIMFQAGILWREEE